MDKNHLPSYDARLSAYLWSTDSLPGDLLQKLPLEAFVLVPPQTDGKKMQLDVEVSPPAVQMTRRVAPHELVIYNIKLAAYHLPKSNEQTMCSEF